MMDIKGFERKPVTQASGTERWFSAITAEKQRKKKQQCLSESVLRTSETAIRYGNCIIQGNPAMEALSKTQLINQELPVYRNNKMQSSGGDAKL
jgi:hypothetical protein